MTTNWNQLQSADNPLTVFPTAYMPPISYLSLLKESSQLTIEAHEHYIKQSIRNRAYILSANRIQSLTIPIKRNKNLRITSSQAEIDNKTPWQQNHLRSIRSAYGKAPYFDYYYPDIEKIILTPFDKMIELNTTLTSYILNKVKLDIPITKTESYISEYKNDYRNIFSKDGKVPQIKHKAYIQAFCDRFEFTDNLSSIDLLFNTGTEALAYLWAIDKQSKIKTKKRKLQESFLFFLAESEGFEPPDPWRSTVFKTAAFDHSANFPSAKIRQFFNPARKIFTFLPQKKLNTWLLVQKIIPLQPHFTTKTTNLITQKWKRRIYWSKQLNTSTLKKSTLPTLLMQWEECRSHLATLPMQPTYSKEWWTTKTAL